MKMLSKLIGCIVSFGIAHTVSAVTVDFPTAAGDIAIAGAGGWDTMPTSQDLARFSKYSGGVYAASDDVEFGSIYVSKSATFNLHTSGNKTVKVANFAIAVDNMTAILNGGVWDISGTTSGTGNNVAGAFGPCNRYATKGTLLELANGCVVTNVTYFNVSNGGNGNTLRISDNSQVYTQNAYFENNYVGYETPACNGLLEVTSGGGLTVSERFYVGANSGSSNNTARFENGAKFNLKGVKVGRNGASWNTLEICGSSTGKFVNAAYVGSENGGSHGNKLIVSNANLECSIVYVSPTAESSSNAFYIAGADTSFTATVTNVARYPFVYRGSHNTFEMDGATWNYWNTMQLDDAASSNTIRFVNGARLNVENGIVSGTNHVASCGNRVYVGNGSELNLLFLHISRCDNIVTVSNSTISATRTIDSWSGIRFGAKLANVDESNIGGNGLVIQGNSPSVSAVREVKFENRSFLRFETPEGSYSDGCVPLTARAVSISDDSSLEVECAFGRMSPGKYTLISTTAGITIPEGVLAAANDSLSAQGNTAARLLLADGGKTLLLAVSKGTVVSIR